MIEMRQVGIEYALSDVKYSTFKEYVFQSLRRDKVKRTFRALEGIDLTIHQGEAVALLGHNGSGKSTLLKVIAGILEASTGNCKVVGRIAPMIELGAGFDAELNGIDNIYLSCTMMGLSEGEISSRLDAIIDFAELRNFIRTPVKNYSSGMQARLGFACATAVDADILLVDEVLAVGDGNFARKCLERIRELRKNNTALVLVSHDLSTVRQFCERGVVLKDGQLVYDGNIFESIDIHLDQLEVKSIENMPAEMQAEKKRQLSLKKADLRAFHWDRSTLPECEVSSEFVQEPSAGLGCLDLARPFTLTITLQARHPERFQADMSIGWALLTETGQRVGGCNNLLLNKELKLPPAQQDKVQVQMDFVFAEGIANLSARKFRLLVGVHDAKLTRTVFIQETLTIDTINTRLGINGDDDFLGLAIAITDVRVR
jgi:ABC-2 type transport system ATP-binding protein